jgi:tRNA threonylcarbamoyladenosine biosynthesis protein TsaE
VEKVMSELSVETSSPAETRELGRRIGALIEVPLTISLTGELGAGKTVFVKGLCEGLGVRDLVTSPSFIIVNEYEGRLPVFHVDLYRLDSDEEIRSTGLDDLLREDGVTVIEWAEKAAGRITRPVLDVFLEYAGESCRRIRITARGEEAAALVDKLGAASPQL